MWDINVNLSDYVDTVGIRQTNVDYDDFEVDILNRPQGLAGSSQCSDGIAVIRQSTPDQIPNGRLVFNNKYLWNIEQLATPYRLQMQHSGCHKNGAFGNYDLHESPINFVNYLGSNRCTSLGHHLAKSRPGFDEICAVLIEFVSSVGPWWGGPPGPRGSPWTRFFTLTRDY